MTAVYQRRSIAALLLAALLQAACATPARPWNTGGDFELGPFDTGNVVDQCLAGAPWGGRSWGVHAYAWGDDREYPLQAARFASWGQTGYLYGHESAGRWGLVRFIQGDVWKASVCGAEPPWYRPAPLPTYRKHLTLLVDVYRDLAIREKPGSDRIMFAINAWFGSPKLPKRLVMDLILFLEPGGDSYSFQDRHAYHYQDTIGVTPDRAWQSWSIDLSEHIRRALAHRYDIRTDGTEDSADISHAEETLALHQLEFLLELRHARAAASIDNFSLIVKEDGL